MKITYLTLYNQRGRVSSSHQCSHSRDKLASWLLQKPQHLVLCDHLEGWDREGGRETQEGGDMRIYVHVELIHFVIKQKLTHHCKAIILQ